MGRVNGLGDDDFCNMKRLDELDDKLQAEEVAEEYPPDEEESIYMAPLEDWPSCARCGSPRPIGVRHPKDVTGKLCWFCAEEVCQGCG